MNGILIILIGIGFANFVLSFYILTYIKEMEAVRMAQVILSKGEEKKVVPDERKRKISESQKARWAKKKGANHMIAPVTWPSEQHQAVN